MIDLQNFLLQSSQNTCDYVNEILQRETWNFYLPSRAPENIDFFLSFKTLLSLSGNLLWLGFMLWLFLFSSNVVEDAK